VTHTSSNKILSRIYGKKRGQVITPKDFLDIASHETVRQTLRRLTDAGTIRRLMRGVYEYPVISTLFKGPAPPDPDAIARAIARTHGWSIFPEGNTALNILGLSTQVPAQWQYFSDGPTRAFTWDGGTLVFKHRTNKETSSLSHKTGLLTQALKTLGPTRVTEQVLKTVLEKLSTDDLNRAIREARYVTSWVYEVIKKLREMKEVHND